MNKSDAHIITGMSRDMTEARFSKKFAWDARNIRITQMEEDDSTMLAVTNEKGAKCYYLEDIRDDYTCPNEATILGSCVVKDYLVVFITGIRNGTQEDAILRIFYNQNTDEFSSKIIALGDFDFDKNRRVETIGLYENEQNIKVYWVDGINQPRMVNVSDEAIEINGIIENAAEIDFVTSGHYAQFIEVKQLPSNGYFPSGTIQYAVSFFKQFGQTSPIIDTSPLYYLSPEDVGLSAEGNAFCSFKITISELGSLPTIFDTVRIYSILRTSENATPVVKIVQDVVIDRSERTISVLDTGNIGSTIDSTLLLFLGGTPISAETLTSKDNTLFLGNIKEITQPVGELTVVGDERERKLKDWIRDEIANEEGLRRNCVTTIYRYSQKISDDSFYNYEIDNHRSSYRLTTFKSGENYRLGFIAMDKYGKWSEAIWLGDFTVDKVPDIEQNIGFEFTVPTEIVNTLYNAEYKHIAPVVVYPSLQDRYVICQGVLNGTVFNVGDRADNSPFAQADWRFRPGYGYSLIQNEIQTCAWSDYSGDINTDKFNIRDAPFYPGLVYGNNTLISGYAGNVPPLRNWYGNGEFVDSFREYFYRDAHTLTLHSPDIEHYNFSNGDFSNTYLQIKGYVNIYNSDDYIWKQTIYGECITNEATSKISDVENITIYPDNTTQRNAVDLPFINTGTTSNLYGPRGQGCSYACNQSIFNNATLDNRKYLNRIYIWHSQYVAKEVNYVDVSSRYKIQYNRSSELFYGKTHLYEINDCPSALEYSHYLSMDSDVIEYEDDDESRKYYPIIDKVLPPNLRSNTTIWGFNQHPLTYDEDTHTYSPVDRLFELVTVPNNSNIKTPDERLSGPYNHCGYFFTPYGKYLYTKRNPMTKESGYPRKVFGYTSDSPVKPTDNYDRTAFADEWCADAVKMSYKTPPHLLINLDGSSVNCILFDPIFGEYSTTSGNSDELSAALLPDDYFLFNKFFWGDAKNNSINTTDTFIEDFHVEHGFLIADICRNVTPEWEANRFGGNSEQVLSTHNWIKCGRNSTVYSPSSGASTTVLFSQGDTYYGRYDFIKSYPKSYEDYNQHVSILSTELESRVNLDLRYDKNRGLEDNTMMNPTNFNLFNRPGYEQSGNYFTYHSLNYRKFQTKHFPNMITWSLEKTLGEDLDTWTSINLMSTMDLDGSKGEIVKLANFKNEIYTFQPRALSQVLFNARVQIPVSDGQPVEITNGTKTSYRKLFDGIGTANKWSVLSTPTYLYFVDDEKNALYSVGDGLVDLSNKFGFKKWFSDHTSSTMWNTSNNSILTLYDKSHNDVYFISQDEVLVYSESLGVFTSFMDYQNMRLLEYLNGAVIAGRDTVYGDRGNAFFLYRMFAGNYNQLLDDKYHLYSITIISNEDPLNDKIFNTVSWRNDVLDIDSGEYDDFSTFEIIGANTSHQLTGAKLLEFKHAASSNLKKKFNVFRAFIPREGGTRKRIRNPWAKIVLSTKNPHIHPESIAAQNKMMKLYDLSVEYTI